METTRQDPDLLLRTIRENCETPGKLKIFFGYAAGVGKTYAMLQAARQAKERGVDVAVGYVEPHARPQTAALLEGLEQLPTKQCRQGGVCLNEFDLDGALRRRPQLLLVDELAHTNALDCRNAKRYQDVRELLRAGIDVYTTVNVQHIESLNDQVASITGVLVRERIPDSVFDQADQVELVDIEPRDLLERLAGGSVYRPEQAARAAEHFFTVENLTALRELIALGITVHFEKENIDTDTLTTELMVSVSAALAQEESVSISKNQRISYQRRMERGEFITCYAPLGYRLADGKNLEIVAEEAETVRWIFQQYLAGYSAGWIAAELSRRQIPNYDKRKIHRRQSLSKTIYNGCISLCSQIEPWRM